MKGEKCELLTEEEIKWFREFKKKYEKYEEEEKLRANDISNEERAKYVRSIVKPFGI